MTKRVLVPLANGFEETEAVTVIDILRRGALEVVTAGLTPGPITGRSNITVTPDTTLDDALGGEPFDAIVLPGGLPNAEILRDDQRVTDALSKILDQGGLAGAICAAPIALDKAGVLGGRKYTSHPSFESALPADGYCEDRVVSSTRVVTSRGPGTAMEFAFELLNELGGDGAVREVNQGVLAVL
ncbi:MAG: DJ-1/PfpI family protein [Deltaproteobacteria bacterium]|nr:DJ-1/PfpI family protein [Deltaproteobacteria bacterium]